MMLNDFERFILEEKYIIMSQMNSADDLPQRWYDQDPVLKRALEQLRGASDRYQAQVALNIIKIILEHQAEERFEMQSGGDSWVKQVKVHPNKRRWYDMNETLRAAMKLLEDAPDDLQHTLVPHIVQMVEDTLAQEMGS